MEPIHLQNKHTKTVRVLPGQFLEGSETHTDENLGGGVQGSLYKFT